MSTEKNVHRKKCRPKQKSTEKKLIKIVPDHLFDPTGQGMLGNEQKPFPAIFTNFFFLCDFRIFTSTSPVTKSRSIFQNQVSFGTL